MNKINEEILKIYNDIADAYDRELWLDMPYNNEIDEFLSLVKGKTILDVGCAIGSFTNYIALKGYEVDGIDISNKMIEIARRKVSNVNFYIMDMLDLKLTKKYNGIMGINSLIHIEKKHMLALIKNLSSLLKDDGILFLIMQEGNGEKYVTEPLDISITNEFVNYYQTSELETLFKEAKLEIISMHKIIDENAFELGNNQLAYLLKKNT